MRSIALLLSLVASGAALAQAAPEPAFTRDRATAIIADWRRIVTPGGVDERLAIAIGGTTQWLSVRGRDRRNPILLVIHGGPASPEMPMSWAYASGWEDYFTVVQWDQRGAGKSYGANDPAAIAPTLSLDRIVEDAGEVTQFLRTRYAKERIFVLGHSWGSIVGVSLAQRHPEWLLAYVGMGQFVGGVANERGGYEQTLKTARDTGNAVAVRELESIAPYPERDGSVPLAKIDIERKWSVKFGGLSWGRTGLNYYSHLADLSPDYTERDVRAIDQGAELSVPALLPGMMAVDFGKTTTFHCPVILFNGRHDTTTPADVAAGWFARVEAPEKRLVWFENSAHMMEVEEPGRVLVHLVEDVLPLARRPAEPTR
jgi:pimeloyl-ACP methyl ester carboxylesterase